MSQKMLSGSISGIHTAALNAIEDENARIALQSVVDGVTQYNLRAKEYWDGVVQKITKANQDAYEKDLTIKPKDIARVINDLQFQIMESKLFKDLGLRVDLIDKPGGVFERLEEAETVLKTETEQRVDGDAGISKQVEAIGVRVGNSETAIKDEIDQRVNADNAITERVNTQYSAVNDSMALIQNKQTTLSNSLSSLATLSNQIQAQVGSNSAAIQQESQARASADGTLYAQTFIKLDVGGRVAGVGLANDGKVSDFIVRADRFSIASPTGTDALGNQISPSMPFIVLTTPTVLNGQAVQPGVYMNHAFMMRGSITAADIGFAQIEAAHIKVAQILKAHIGYGEIVAAHIGDAEIDTLKIAGNAITQPVVVTQEAFEQISFPVATAGPLLVIDMGQFDRGMMSVLVNCSFVVSRDSITSDLEFPSWIQWRVIQENTGAVIMGGGFSLPNGSTHHVVDFNVTRVPRGVNRFFLQVGGMDGYGVVYSVRLSALGAKR